MIALLHYVYLKSLRDTSLIAFIIVPILAPVAALSGVTLGKGHMHYPFYLNVQFSAVQNATLVSEITLAVCVLFAVIPAFWTLRPEIATRSVGAFFFAARPLTVALALILFAFAIGLAGWIGAMTMIGALTTALPPHVAFMTLKVAAGLLASSALGTLLVTISPQPGMIVGAYLGCVFLVPWIVASKSSAHLIAAVAVAIVCAVLAAFFMERRCAS